MPRVALIYLNRHHAIVFVGRQYQLAVLVGKVLALALAFLSRLLIGRRVHFRRLRSHHLVPVRLLLKRHLSRSILVFVDLSEHI